MTRYSQFDPEYSAVLAHIPTLTNTDLTGLVDAAARAARVLRDIRVLAILAGYSDPFAAPEAARRTQAYLDTRRTNRTRREEIVP